MPGTPRTAIVVGGTRRVGRWVSEALLVEGQRVHAVFKSDGASADAFADEMQAAGYRLHTHRCDALDYDAMCKLAEQVAVEEGGIDILINASGSASDGTIIGTDSATLSRVFDDNVLAVHNAVRACNRYLRIGGGSIVNFLSTGNDSIRSYKAVAVYGAAKTALASYSRSLARELAPDQVTVNCIALGITELAAEGVPQFDAEHVPSGVLVSQREVAGAIWYLTGETARQTTGSVLTLSGGFGL
ncbi:SDR family oxidoreductase [bacterium]|nr:SDR family oxidoreductase [bacterium]